MLSIALVLLGSVALSAAVNHPDHSLRQGKWRYEVVPIPRTLADARADCKDRGGMLMDKYTEEHLAKWTGEAAYLCQFRRPYLDIGCWYNRIPQQVTRLEGKHDALDSHYQERTNAIVKCFEAARDHGYAFFGVGHHGQCWAGNGKEYEHYGAVPEADCPNLGEGFYGGIHVYVIGKSLDAQCGKEDTCAADHSACITHSCKCVKGYTKKGDRCVPQTALSLGTKCKILNEPCADTNSECRAFYCRCKADFVQQGNVCVAQNTLPHGAECRTLGAPCGAANSACHAYKCTCKTGWFIQGTECNI